MVNDLACHMLVLCVFVSNLNVHAKPEKLRPSGDTTGIYVSPNG